MDKYEYKIRADEIKDLIAVGEYAQAAEIADSIDWRRVKSVMMLCTISDLYKINRRYEDARDMLLLAYERRPGGRTICYSLCELSIKMEEYVQAVEYYKEFVQIAPKDSGRYILQYKLYEAQDVSLEERIEVLEELKKKDYREKWAYELAYLYHRIGLGTRCVEECDELILWFGEGKYVVKAMELKMLHQPLTPDQQEKYDHRFDAPGTEEPLQAEAAPGDTQVYESVKVSEASASTPIQPDEEMDIQVKTVDVGEYNTINLQAELAEGLKEVLGEDSGRTKKKESITRSIMEPMYSADTETLDYPEIDEVDENDLEAEGEEIEETEVFFGETAEIGDLRQEAENMTELILPEEAEEAEESADSEDGADSEDSTAHNVMEQLRLENAGENTKEMEDVLRAQPPRELERVLSQESDGQISLVVPQDEPLEKQITGQMNIQDVLAEWERMKKENQEKNEEALRRQVLEQTGSMFTEFEASVRDGLLEQIESGSVSPLQEPSVAEAAGDTKEELQEAPPVPEKPAESEEDVFCEEAVFEESDEGANPAETQEGEAAEEFEEAVEEFDEVEELEEIEEESTPKPEVEREKAKVRSLTREERELYAPFIQSKSAREQLVKAIDNISMAAYAGNVIITGEEGMDTLTLAKNMIREVQMTDSNFSGKVAKISGQALNGKDVEKTIEQLKNGALIIQKASGMNEDTIRALHKSLQQERMGIIVLLEDTRKAMDKMLAANEQLFSGFSARIDVEALSNDTLVAFGRKYAREMEYSIDELGILALHTRIEDLQTIDHVVTVVEVKDIVDEAIHHTNKKTIGHFFDVLFAKRYDDEDMIILTEKDFV